MNQKYLQGISSDMENLDSTVFFEATPENISAFLARHRWAEMSAIGTMKDQSFLTAKMGLIDTCPDQEYLAKKILPIYAKVQIQKGSKKSMVEGKSSPDSSIPSGSLFSCWTRTLGPSSKACSVNRKW